MDSVGGAPPTWEPGNTTPITVEKATITYPAESLPVDPLRDATHLHFGMATPARGERDKTPRRRRVTTSQVTGLLARRRTAPFRPRKPTGVTRAAGAHGRCQRMECDHSPCRRRDDWRELLGGKRQPSSSTASTGSEVPQSARPRSISRSTPTSPRVSVLRQSMSDHRSKSSEALSCSPPHHHLDALHLALPLSPKHPLCRIEDLIQTPRSPSASASGSVHRDRSPDSDPDAGCEVWESLYCVWRHLADAATPILCTIGVVRYQYLSGRHREMLPLDINLFKDEMEVYKSKRALSPRGVRTDSASSRPYSDTVCSDYVTTEQYRDRARAAITRLANRFQIMVKRGTACSILCLDGGASLARLRALALSLGVALPPMSHCDIGSYARALLPHVVMSKMSPRPLAYTEFGAIPVSISSSSSSSASSQTSLTSSQSSLELDDTYETSVSVVPPALHQMEDAMMGQCLTVIDAARQQGRLFCNLHAYSSYKMGSSIYSSATSPF